MIQAPQNKTRKDFNFIGAHYGPFVNFLQKNTGHVLWMIPFFTNVFVGLVFFFLGSEFILKYLLKLDNLPAGHWAGLVITVLHWFVCLIFLWPILKIQRSYSKSDHADKKLLQKARNRIINYPMFLVANVYMFWLIRIPVFWIINQEMDYPFVPIISVTLLATILSAMIQFYVADLQNRFLFIPYWFPDGNIKVTFNLFRSVSLIQRFIDLFLINGLFPVVVICGIILLVVNYGQHDPDELYRTMVSTSIAGVVFLLFGLFMSMMSAKTFILPVNAMVKAASEIAKENYNIRLSVQSNDQLGKLQSSMNQMAVELEEKKTIKTLFGHYVSKEIRDLILGGQINTNGDKIEAVVLFSDIRSFTSLTEKYEPQKVINLLNTHFSSIVRAVSDNQGFVDKFIGDAVMAVFDAELCENNHRQFALNAALTILSGMNETNRKLNEMKLDNIQIGVGMACGDVIRGNIGADDRRELTVVGDTVNIASRLEALTKDVGWPLVATRSSIFLQGDEVPGFNMSHLDPIKLRGKSKFVEVLGMRPVTL